jgi:hypothetical protein
MKKLRRKDSKLKKRGGKEDKGINRGGRGSK